MAPEPCAFRKLGRTDVPVLRELTCVLGDAFGEIETYQGSPPRDDYLQRLLEKDHFIALVGVVSGEVAGGLVAYQLDKFEQDRREIYIYDLAVAEPHRRKGIATGLINALREIAAARDVYVIFVQADLVDAPAIALYDSLGAKETAHHFDIEVRPLAVMQRQPG